MHTVKRKNDFINTNEGTEIIELLKLMVLDDAYCTDPTYSANVEMYPDNLVPFIDKHITYLSNHAGTNPRLYISNLRLITRISSTSKAK